MPITPKFILLATAPWLIFASPSLAQSEEDIKKILAKPIDLKRFTWAAGGMPVRMVPVEGNICVLTKFSGKMEGYGERVGIRIDKGTDNTPMWTLDGATGQGALRVEVTCVGLVHFAPGWPRNIQSKLHPLIAHNSCTPKNFGASPIGAAYFITSIAGKFSGGGERIEVMGSGASISACSGAVQAGLISYMSPGQQAVFRSKDGLTTSLSQATFVTDVINAKTEDKWWHHIPGAGGKPFSLNLPPRTIPLAPLNEAICGLTRIQGDFNGYGEEVAIGTTRGSDGTMWWTLTAATQANGGHATAAARCFARDQRDPKTRR